MASPSQFERLLSQDAARQYMPVRFSVWRALQEALGSAETVSSLMGEDMLHFQQLRAKTRVALASEAQQQTSTARQWRHFLRPRIEMLDFWSSAFAAFTAFFAAVLGSGAVVMRPLGLDYLYLLAAGFGTVTLVFLKFFLDRQKAWYKYLTAHLEAIESGV